MKFIFFSLLLALVCVSQAIGQDLVKSRPKSSYTYIFKLTNSEATELYANRSMQIDASFLHTPVDSFKTDEQYLKRLSPGHYLRAHSHKNSAKFELASINNCDAYAMNNNKDLVIQVYDLDGKIIDNAEVSINNDPLQYDSTIRSYIDRKSNRRGVLRVVHQGVVNLVDLNRRGNNSAFIRTKIKVLYGTPIKYIWRPVRFIVDIPISGVRSLLKWRCVGAIWSTKQFFVRRFQQIFTPDYYFRKRDNGFEYHGYAVMSQPKYRLGDTLRFKTFLVDKKGKPITKPIYPHLIVGRKKVELPALNCYRNGAYKGVFHLHDSLNLKSDRQYRISFKNEDGENYESVWFRIEDYELKGIKLALRTDVDTHFKGDSVRLYIKATDSNKLNLQGARAQVVIKCVKQRRFFVNKTFIPDTLLYREIDLKPSGETTFAIFDSLLQKVNMKCQFYVRVLTSDNQAVTQRKTFDFFYHKKEIACQAVGDSLELFYKIDGVRQDDQVDCFACDRFGNKTQLKVSSTHKVKLSAYHSSYELSVDSITKSFDLSQHPSGINCYSERNKDSIFITVSNQRKLPFVYHLYRQNKLLKKANATELNLRMKNVGAKYYYFNLNYLWGGEISNETYKIPLVQNRLNLAVTEPQLVYPGQEKEIEIKVTDQNNKPVEDVDITALGLTSKFKFSAPSVPTLERKRKEQELINTFLMGDVACSERDQDLDYDQWCRLARIDTIEYYRFTYPGNKIYKSSFKTSDGVTQFAPYVMDDGQPKLIHVISVDSKPVYFSWSDTNKGYSFAVDSGYHQVKLRTTDYEFTIDSVNFHNGHKTFMSINENIIHPNVTREILSSKLSISERELYKKYIIPYKANFGSRWAYLESGDHIELLGTNRSWSRNTKLAGPITGSIRFGLMDGYSLNFVTEPDYQLEFAPQLLKMREFSNSRYPSCLVDGVQRLSLRDSVLTKDILLKLWNESKNFKRTKVPQYKYPKQTSAGAGKLKFEFGAKASDSIVNPLNIVMIRYDDHNFFRIYRGSERLMHQLNPALYKMILFYREGYYTTVDSISIRSNGINYRKLSDVRLLPPDDFSMKITELLEENLFVPITSEKQQSVERTAFNTYRRSHEFTGNGFYVEGRVVTEDGESLPGANVLVPGTTYGMVCDIDGIFAFKVPHGTKKIEFDFIGMKSRILDIDYDDFSRVVLEEAECNLDEVVTIAYGVRRRRCATVSSVLQGRMPGVNTTVRSPNILIRGVSSISNQKPLIIVDGKVFNGDLSSINPDIIGSTQILKDAAATAIYGSQASNGVIVITTKNRAFKNTATEKVAIFDQSFLNQSMSNHSLRTNFSDNAFWQPSLTTNSEGIARFKVKFPDDITSWQTNYFAMNSHKQTGQAQGNISSYKPMMAQLSVPRFMVVGDSCKAIGKVVNYTTDTLRVNTQLFVNNKKIENRTHSCINAAIDSLHLVASSDSMSVKYTMKTDKGFFDGEQRKVPVFPVGLKQYKSSFFVLNNDTTIAPKFESNLGKVKLYAKTSMLDIVVDEIYHLRNYRYSCNEQLASKLKALLLDYEICKAKQVRFKHDKDVKKIIRLLQKSRHDDGLWGWWKTSLKSNQWISIHVLEALLQAQKNGFKNTIDFEWPLRHIVWMLETDMQRSTSTRMLTLAKMLDASIDYQKYLKVVESKGHLSLTEKLQIALLKQKCDIKQDLDFLNKYEHKTLFDGVYYSDNDPDYYWYDNSITNTVLAYRLLRNTDANNHKLTKIRNFFFEKRRRSHWRNTFESAQIISAIVPDIMLKKGAAVKPKLTITGAINKTITEFPYEVNLAAADQIKVEKHGTFPVYLGCSQSYWNPKPKEKQSDFIIKSSFKDKNDNTLKAGEEVTLVVEVNVLKDSEFLMINVPIPAGCSYASKRSFYRNETHREYFRNETAIFCEKLKEGTYHFEVKLQCRFAGNYHLNPARVEQMYFTKFNANTSMKHVEIR